MRQEESQAAAESAVCAAEVVQVGFGRCILRMMTAMARQFTRARELQRIVRRIHKFGSKSVNKSFEG